MCLKFRFICSVILLGFCHLSLAMENTGEEKSVAENATIMADKNMCTMKNYLDAFRTGRLECDVAYNQAHVKCGAYLKECETDSHQCLDAIKKCEAAYADPQNYCEHVMSTFETFLENCQALQAEKQ